MRKIKMINITNYSDTKIELTILRDKVNQEKVKEVQIDWNNDIVSIICESGKILKIQPRDYPLDFEFEGEKF
jgi:hypothetical protein